MSVGVAVVLLCVVLVAVLLAFRPSRRINRRQRGMRSDVTHAAATGGFFGIWGGGHGSDHSDFGGGGSFGGGDGGGGGF